MRKTVLTFIAFILAAWPGESKNKQKPTTSQTPLSAEQLELYGIFLDSFVGDGKEPVNFSDRTLPFVLLDSDQKGPCLEGIKLNSSQDAAQTVHIFPTSIAEGRSIRLVDPKKHKLKDPGKAIKNGESVGDAVAAGFQAGLLSVSEVAFDEAHRFAVLRFSFICGSLCGRGGTLVFEKVDGKWRKSNRACPLWIA